MIKRRLQTAQTVKLFCLLFLETVIIHMITLLVTLELFPIFEHHMTKFYGVI